MVTNQHRVRSVYVNGCPVWECRRCGRRWLSTVDYRRIERWACQR